MKNIKCKHYLVGILLSFCFVLPVHAALINIDLNDFFSDPSVVVSPSGTTATLNEDSSFSPVLLINDPGLGDPNVIIAAANRELVFDYSFVEGAGENDQFTAFILDGNTGGSLGGAFEFYTDSTDSGTVRFDLSSLSLSGSYGLQFELASFDRSYESFATVSNVVLDTADAQAVPEPSTLFLLMMGCLAGIKVKRSKSTI